MESDRRVRPEKDGAAMVNGAWNGRDREIGDRSLASLELLFDRPTANATKDVCTLEHVINRCAQPVKPSQFATLDEEDEGLPVGASLFEPRVVTDDAVIQKMQQCVKAAVEKPCKEGANCRPCGDDLLRRIGGETFVTQDADVGQLLKCYSEKGEDREACFEALPFKARFVGQDRWGQAFYASSEASLDPKSDSDEEEAE